MATKRMFSEDPSTPTGFDKLFGYIQGQIDVLVRECLKDGAFADDESRKKDTGISRKTVRVRPGG